MGEATRPYTLVRPDRSSVETSDPLTIDGYQSFEPRKIRAVIADDHLAMRYLLRRLLARSRPNAIEVVGEAIDGRNAVELVELLQPDVIVMDVNMPQMNGIEAAQAISVRWPSIAIFGWTTCDDESTRQAMLRAGAKDVFLKNGTFADMLAAIRYGSDDDQDPEPTSGAA